MVYLSFHFYIFTYKTTLKGDKEVGGRETKTRSDVSCRRRDGVAKDSSKRMVLSLETSSRNLSNGQLADIVSRTVRGPRSHAKTCAVKLVKHQTFFVIISLFITFCFCCLEVEQSCDTSPVLSVSVMSPTQSLYIFISVCVLLFLGRDASKYETLHCRAF